MRKTFKYRLNPTSAQRTALQTQLEWCRWAYNQTLAVRRTAWQERKVSLWRYATNKLLTQWKQAHTWLQTGHAQAMQETLCSGCGQMVPKDLSVRVHDCPHCGLKLNRDHNAALNILARGLASMGNQSLEAP